MNRTVYVLQDRTDYKLATNESIWFRHETKSDTIWFKASPLVSDRVVGEQSYLNTISDAFI